MTPLASSAFTRRQIGAADRPTCSVSCWADARPSCCSPFRILRSILSMATPKPEFSPCPSVRPTAAFVCIRAAVVAAGARTLFPVFARTAYGLRDAVHQHGQYHDGNPRLGTVAGAQALNCPPDLAAQPVSADHGRDNDHGQRQHDGLVDARHD